VPQLRHAEHRRQADQDHGDGGVDLRGADQLARIDAVGENAAEQRQGELGHEAAQVDETELCLRSGDLEGEPAQREREHVLADDLRHQGQPVIAKIAYFQREEGIGFFFHERGVPGGMRSLPHGGLRQRSDRPVQRRRFQCVDHAASCWRTAGLRSTIAIESCKTGAALSFWFTSVPCKCHPRESGDPVVFSRRLRGNDERRP